MSEHGMKDHDVKDHRMKDDDVTDRGMKEYDVNEYDVKEYGVNEYGVTDHGMQDHATASARRAGHRATTFSSLLALAGFVAAMPLYASAADGKAVYQKNCAACHMASGQGIPGAFPALAGNAFVQGPAKDPATVLLKGRGGMPDFSQSLTDGDIAAVLTYARSSWGNKAEGLSDKDVAALRTEISAELYSGGQMANKH